MEQTDVSLDIHTVQTLLDLYILTYIKIKKTKWIKFYNNIKLNNSDNFRKLNYSLTNI